MCWMLERLWIILFYVTGEPYTGEPDFPVWYGRLLLRSRNDKMFKIVQDQTVDKAAEELSKVVVN